eukprot:752504-Hanusia_phi.AAC.2
MSNKIEVMNYKCECLVVAAAKTEVRICTEFLPSRRDRTDKRVKANREDDDPHFFLVAREPTCNVVLL